MTPRALRSPSRMKVNATSKEVMVPSPSNSIDIDFVTFLAGDQHAGARLYGSLKDSLLRRIRRYAPDLPRDLAEDAVMQVFVLMMERGATFNPTRGSAQGFIVGTLLPEAVRSLRAENAPPGALRRQRKPRVKATMQTASLEAAAEVAAAGYGSPAAMEAACDAHIIWSRSKPAMKVLVGGLMDGKAQADIAAELEIDRFRVARMIRALRHQFANAA
jgi:RNA polymerase sigma-70 factor (ECF subfamily)